jgi:hypothetical protein
VLSAAAVVSIEEGEMRLITAADSAAEVWATGAEEVVVDEATSTAATGLTD